MTWYHYVARDNELFLDLDSNRNARLAFDRLRRNVQTGRLDLAGAYLARSHTPGHWHLCLTLKAPMQTHERIYWELHLRSDVTRALYAGMRTLHGLAGGDVLIADREYRGFRPADGQCSCRGKHKPDRITRHCPVMTGLFGREASAEYFARNRDRKPRTEKLRLPVGNIPLKKILTS